MPDIFNSSFQPGPLPSIIETSDAVKEDWSQVRAPSRAARRRRQGHRQNIRFIPSAYQHVDGTIFAHPAYVAELRRQLAAKMDRDIERVYGTYRVGWM